MTGYVYPFSKPLCIAAGSIDLFKNKKIGQVEASIVEN
jgi:hypothetical protein